MPISADNPQFQDVMSSYGSFLSPLNDVQKEIIKSLNSSDNDFEADMDTFFHLITDADQQALRDVFEKLGYQGTLEMVKPEDPCKLTYHTMFHVLEVMSDSSEEAKVKLENEFPATPETQFLNEFYILLANVAAAWHDVVQEEKPPINEIKSAEQFIATLTVALDGLVNKNKKLKSAMDLLKKHLNYIAAELIVNSTWLVFSKSADNIITALPLAKYTKNISTQLGSQSFDENRSKLFIAARAVSSSDLNRFALNHVIAEKSMLTSLQKLEPDTQKLFDNFFNQNEMKPDEQEQFLGLLGQNFRMFPELNLPSELSKSKPMNETPSYTLQQYMHFVSAMKNTRDSGEDTKADYGAMLSEFISTENKTRVSNLVREQSFAKMQKGDLWHKHANNLQKFEIYIHALDDAKKFTSMGKAICQLSTHYQPGLLMAKKNNRLLREMKTKQFNSDTGNNSDKSLSVALQDITKTISCITQEHKADPQLLGRG